MSEVFVKVGFSSRAPPHPREEYLITFPDDHYERVHNHPLGRTTSGGCDGEQAVLAALQRVAVKAVRQSLICCPPRPPARSWPSSAAGPRGKSVRRRPPRLRAGRHSAPLRARLADLVFGAADCDGLTANEGVRLLRGDADMLRRVDRPACNLRLQARLPPSDAPVGHVRVVAHDAEFAPMATAQLLSTNGGLGEQTVARLRNAWPALGVREPLLPEHPDLASGLLPGPRHAAPAPL